MFSRKDKDLCPGSSRGTIVVAVTVAVIVISAVYKLKHEYDLQDRDCTGLRSPTYQVMASVLTYLLSDFSQCYNCGYE